MFKEYVEVEVAVYENYFGMNFFSLDSSSIKFFGFSEFISGLAIMVVAWTLADTRYRFRVKTAPMPLVGCTCLLLFVVGLLTLATDLWRAQGWLVPSGVVFTPATWQAFLGLLFLLAFFLWALFTLFAPPVFGERNAQRVSTVVYEYVLGGSKKDLAVVADELLRSVGAILMHASLRPWSMNPELDDQSPGKGRRSTESCADEILLLMGDRLFCRAMVEGAPRTIKTVFEKMQELGKAPINLGAFVKNVVGEALESRDSFVYRESNGWDVGKIGYDKPICRVIFGNFSLVEGFDSVYDEAISSFRRYEEWQVRALCRAVLLTFKARIDTSRCSMPCWSIHRVFRGLGECIAYRDASLSCGQFCETKSYGQLIEVMSFFQDALGALRESGSWGGVSHRTQWRYTFQGTCCDELAALFVSIVKRAAFLRGNEDDLWHVHHNVLWDALFSWKNADNEGAKIVQAKVRRALYDEIVRIEMYPNYASARLLRLCLNMTMNSLDGPRSQDGDRPLGLALRSLVKRSFVRLYNEYKYVAEECLGEVLQYDDNLKRIVKRPMFGEEFGFSCSYILLDDA